MSFFYILTFCIFFNEGHPVDVSDNRGWKPIHDAAAENHPECLSELLLHGILVTFRSSCKYNATVQRGVRLYFCFFPGKFIISPI